MTALRHKKKRKHTVWSFHQEKLDDLAWVVCPFSGNPFFWYFPVPKALTPVPPSHPWPGPRHRWHDAHEEGQWLGGGVGLLVERGRKWFAFAFELRGHIYSFISHTWYDKLTTYVIDPSFCNFCWSSQRSHYDGGLKRGCCWVECSGFALTFHKDRSDGFGLLFIRKLVWAVGCCSP